MYCLCFEDAGATFTCLYYLLSVTGFVYIKGWYS